MTARANNRKAVAAGLGAAAPLSFGKRDHDAEAKADRVVVFEIDGVAHTVPAHVPTGTALGLLSVCSALPDEARRGMYLVRELAGTESLAALLADADMTDTDWHELTGRLSKHAFGRLEGGSGN